LIILNILYLITVVEVMVELELVLEVVAIVCIVVDCLNFAGQVAEHIAVVVVVVELVEVVSIVIVGFEATDLAKNRVHHTVRRVCRLHTK
jgi:hypothetical protein